MHREHRNIVSHLSSHLISSGCSIHRLRRALYRKPLLLPEETNRTHLYCREFISIQCDDVILEFPLFTMDKLQFLCNDVNSTQTKLKKLNLPYSVNINFKDSNKCAILDFLNSAHNTGALHLFKESYPIKEITDVDGVLVEVTAALESPRVRVHWYLTQDRCMFQGPAGEVASFTEEFLHSLSNS